MGPITRRDGCGFLLAAFYTTAPLLAVSWLWDNVSLSKEGPIGPGVYLLPVVIGLSAAAFACGAAMVVGWRRTDRLELHATFGCLASLLLLGTSCLWWGEWCFRFAERFRG